MATNIFLGFPPENIKQFIIENYGQKDMTKVPLHFTANEDGSSVSLVCFGYDESNNYTGGFVDSYCEFEYSMTGKDDDWSDYTTGQVVPLYQDETVYFRAKQGNVDGNPNLYGFYTNSGQYSHYFVMKGSIKADGNIQFLLENTGTKMDVPEYCYYRMFDGCKSLTQAPVLPATTLADCCYQGMFASCSSLTQAPELPAETLVNGCYSNMFFYCGSLNNINVNFSAWDPSNATQGWLNGVASEGTFTCPAALPDTPRDESHIPSGWTVVRK